MARKHLRPDSGHAQAGFTVIETLIVLAVAGVIFLIIFNALPALFRNSRNDQRKQDVSTILSAISQYELRNAGNFPPSYGGPGGLTDATTGVGALKLSYYDPSAGVIIHGGGVAGGTDVTTVANPDEVDVYNFYLCQVAGAATPGATSIGAGYRDIVAVYDIETSGAPTLKCQQL